MKNFLLIYLFFGVCFTSHSQNTGVLIGSTSDIDLYLNPMQSDGLYVTKNKSGKAIDQSQYLFLEWNENCQIFFSENKVFAIRNLNYNINSKKLESLIGKDSIFQFNENRIDYIKRDNKKFKFYNFNDSNQLYQELYVSENIIFLKGYKLIFKEAFINPMTNAVISEAKSEVIEKYFCKISDSDYISLDLKKKTILKIMGDKSTQIEKFVSDSKLTYSLENDLIKIFKYYDTL
jgi:hypothetical protein